ncbi:MAG: sugar transferase [Actinobacteria bacterium]|uniref:Unannotated protein n=1 Tax=freshwater metagenome TaxID=449393 RepID=A0A6J7JAP8_9ZZZZ|nr:sugar transferase [Actinomycetota bacterium]
MSDFYRRRGKRIFDVVGSSLGLIASAPVQVATAAAVAATMGRPLFFRQLRPGLGGRPFTLIKFRTMLSAQGAPDPDGSDELRLTGLGRFLRATSIDELPELVNVLTGEMSLVGPRPLLMEYLPRYTPEQARRHEVRPGITGWAQVNGRNALTWEEKFEFDVWYVDHLSLGLDLRILWMTVLKVLRRDGISAEGHATAPEFLGVEAS